MLFPKRTLIVSYSLFLGVFTFAADSPEDNAVKTIRPEAIQAHVTFLADDLLEGRGTGTRGHEIAAKYVAAQFQAMGLKPGGVNGTFLQRVPFRSVVIVPEETSFKLTRSGAEETLVYGEDYYGVGDTRKPTSTLSGQVVYVGHGVTAPDFGIDDYKGLDVRGKIVAFLRTPDPRLPPAEGAHFADVQTRLENAATHGALGAIQIRIEVARAFTRLVSPPRRSIIFLAPTGEEKGLLGSDYFAEHPTVPRSQIVANVNTDSQNLQFDFRDVQVIGAEHSTLGRNAARAAAKLNLEVSPDLQPEQAFFRRSDQYSFVKRGIPSVFLRRGGKAVDPQIDGLKLVNEWYATIYHTPGDDLSQPLNWEAGAKCAKFSFLLGYTIAQDDTRPKWNDGDFFGKTFGGNH